MTSRGCTRILVTVVAAAAVTLSMAERRKLAPGSKKIPDWVRAAAAAPVPDTQADVAWLLREKSVEPLAKGGVRVHERTVGKVLRPEGRAGLGVHALPYHAADSIEQLAIWTLLPDGSAFVPDPELDIADEPAVPEHALFRDSRVRLIVVPHVGVGHVVAHESVVVQATDAGAESFVFGRLDGPVVLSRFSARVPASWSLDLAASRTDGIEVERSPGRIACTARDLAPARETTPPPGDTRPVAWARWWSGDGARGYRDWDAVARWFHALSEPVLLEANGVTPLAERLRDPLGGEPLSWIDAAFAFAAREVRYVSAGILETGYLPSGPARVLERRFGDCKDKTFLMRSILAAWGIASYPVLVRTRDLGPLLESSPSARQFNHALVAAVLPAAGGPDPWSSMDVEGLGRLLFLDPTERQAGVLDLRTDVQGTVALVVRPDGGALVRLPVQPPQGNGVHLTFHASLDERGISPEATLATVWSGSEAVAARAARTTRSAEARRQATEEVVQVRLPGAETVADQVVGLERPGTPLVETLRLKGGQLGRRVGDLLVVEAARDALPLVPFPLPAPPRSSSLDVGPPREQSLEVRIQLPPGWAPEVVPAPIELTGADLIVRTSWSFDDGRLSYVRTARVLALDVPPERYAEFRDSVRRIAAEDARAIVLVYQDKT
jgi:hypothetical protein